MVRVLEEREKPEPGLAVTERRVEQSQGGRVRVWRWGGGGGDCGDEEEPGSEDSSVDA